MKALELWFTDYEKSHRNPSNVLIHKFCVPIILFSIIGTLWSFKIGTNPLVNLSWGIIIPGLVYYFILSMAMFLGMFIQIGLMILACIFLEQILVNPRFLYIFLFAVGWVGQFIGHKIEGKKPSFLEDVLFLLIGPLWVLKFLYNRMNIKY